MIAMIIWSGLIVALVVIRILAAFPRFRRFTGRQATRLWAWLVAHLDRPDEPDELVEEMRRVMRRERLTADVRRVQLLLISDEWMPATRQMGNRIAYDWLVRELDRYTREISDLITHDWSMESGAAAAGRFAPSVHRPRVAQVEVLELGWHR